MKTDSSSISLGRAALIAGLPLFLPVAPFAEFYVFKKLIIYTDAARTTENLLQQPKLFLAGIFAILLMYVIDVVLAWALYIFLKPVNASLSLLTAWLRLVYTGIAIVALFNFLYAYQLVQGNSSDAAGVQDQVLQLVNARRFAMHLAYIFFSIYLVLLGVLIYRASYVPRVFGVMMILAGISWMITNLQPYFFTAYHLEWLMILSIGELFFPIWLLVKGRKLKEQVSI